MAKREPIVVNGQLFKTKEQLREHIRGIRDGYIDGRYLNEDNFEFMLDLLNRHEAAEIKIGCGVASMYVKTNEVFKRNREFWLVRLDGSEADFSFEICLKHETKLQKFKNACRTAVADIVVNFKRDFFDRVGEPAICPVTGEQMTLRHNSHVDHTLPETFDKIVQDFNDLHNLVVDDVDLLTAEDGRVRNEMADKHLEATFIQFHNQKANLRVISKRANLSSATKLVDGQTHEPKDTSVVQLVLPGIRE